MDKTLLYRDEAIKKVTHKLASPGYGLIITSPQAAFMMAHQRKELAKLPVASNSQVFV